MTGRGIKKRGRRRAGKTVRCPCGNVSEGPGRNYDHRDACPEWAKLTNEEQATFGQQAQVRERQIERARLKAIPKPLEKR